jgi:hypothetical protein
LSLLFLLNESKWSTRPTPGTVVQSPGLVTSRARIGLRRRRGKSRNFMVKERLDGRTTSKQSVFVHDDSVRECKVRVVKTE